MVLDLWRFLLDTGLLPFVAVLLRKHLLSIFEIKECYVKEALCR
jgi:hypothetical protein